MVRITSSNDIKKRIAIDILDRCEGSLMASFVFVLLVVELLHHLDYVNSCGKFHVPIEILRVEFVKRNNTRHPEGAVLTNPTQALGHSLRQLHESIRFKEVDIATIVEAAFAVVRPNPTIPTDFKEGDHDVVPTAP